MSLRAVRIGATLYFVLFALFVMWPVFVPFNHPLPLVFGLPFNMALIALWVAFSSVVLFVLDRSEEQHREAGDRAGGNRAWGDREVGDRAGGNRQEGDGAGGEARPPVGRQDRPAPGLGEG